MDTLHSEIIAMKAKLAVHSITPEQKREYTVRLRDMEWFADIIQAEYKATTRSTKRSGTIYKRSGIEPHPPDTRSKSPPNIRRKYQDANKVDDFRKRFKALNKLHEDDEKEDWFGP